MRRCNLCTKTMTRVETYRNFYLCNNCVKKEKDEEDQERQKEEEVRHPEAGKHIRGGVVSSDGKHIYYFVGEKRFIKPNN